MAARDVLEVGLDLRLGRVATRPPRVRVERELVQVRRDVAGGAGIGVVVPDTADALAALEHRHVVDSRPGAASRPRRRRRSRRRRRRPSATGRGSGAVCRELGPCRSLMYSESTGPVECDRRGINLPVECDRRASSKGSRHARSRHRRRDSDPDRACPQGLAGPTAAGRDPGVRHRPGPGAQPGRRPRERRGGDRRLRPAAGPAGEQHRAHRGAAERQAGPGDRGLDHLALLLLRPRRDPRRGEQRRGRAGPHLCRRGRRVRLELQRRAGGSPPRGPARAAAGKRRPSGRVHRDGPDRRERRGALRRLA